MHPLATRNHPLHHQLGQPLRAKPCRCIDEPAADPREMTCIRCGRQVGGVPLPSYGVGARQRSSARPSMGHRRPRYRIL